MKTYNEKLNTSKKHSLAGLIVFFASTLLLTNCHYFSAPSETSLSPVPESATPQPNTTPSEPDEIQQSPAEPVLPNPLLSDPNPVV